MRSLGRAGAFGLATAASFGFGAGPARAGGHSRVVYYYAAPTTPVAVTPVAAVPVAVHGHGHHAAPVGLMMVPTAAPGFTAASGFTAAQGVTSAPSGFAAMPTYTAGAVPTYSYGVSGYTASPGYVYYSAPTTPRSATGAGFGASPTGVSAEIRAMSSNPSYQALAAYMGNDMTRVYALRSNLADQLKKILQQTNGTMPPRNWIQSILKDAAQEFLSLTPFGPAFNTLEPYIQDLIDDLIGQQGQAPAPPVAPPAPGAPSTPSAPAPAPAAGTAFTFQVTGVTLQGTFVPSTGTPTAPTLPTPGAPGQVPQAILNVPVDPRGPAPATTN